MAVDSILRSYGDVNAKEDVVLNAIEYITAIEDSIFSALGKTKAINTIHSYLTDTNRTAASIGVEEASDYTASPNTTPSRLTNIVQICALNYKVSRTQQNISHYSGTNELARQTQKALRDWANAVEFDLVRGTLTSGASGTAAKMSGIIEATSLANNHTSHASGTTWSATILDALMKNCWDNSNGDVATDLYMGSFLRNATDGFVPKTNVVVNGSQTNLIKTVTSYQTAFGTLRLHTHRHIQATADATARVLAIRPEKLKVAFLEKPYVDTGLSRSGDYDNRAVVGKLTLEVHNQNSHFYADGFDKD